MILILHIKIKFICCYLVLICPGKYFIFIIFAFYNEDNFGIYLTLTDCFIILMIESFLKFQELINNNIIKFMDKIFNKVIQDYSFFHISENDCFDFEHYQQVYQNIEKSNIMIINESSEDDQGQSEIFFIIRFHKTFIIFNEKLISIIEKLLSNNQSLFICNISNNKTISNQLKNIRNNQIVIDQVFKEEIQSFNRRFQQFECRKMQEYA